MRKEGERVSGLFAYYWWMTCCCCCCCSATTTGSKRIHRFRWLSGFSWRCRHLLFLVFFVSLWRNGRIKGERRVKKKEESAVQQPKKRFFQKEHSSRTLDTKDSSVFF